ncbi:dual specificity protein phosphatase family protein [Candidatus Sumerlaeota bacterium]|nr:dual specificity protein phosphatase family protein [Candidatus Sumerlaeota bacterium]
MLRNFSFVIDGVLAGCAMPGLQGPLSGDLAEARKKGVVGVVSLTQRAFFPAVVQESGIRYLHLPVEDFTAPTPEQMQQFTTFVDQVRAEGGAVMVHCFAGVGRTGTMLAAYLVKEGMTAQQAIDRVRELRPGSIETHQQEDAVADWEAWLRK